jgi:eukaryotic-like serine/threonine-protein kinase
MLIGTPQYVSPEQARGRAVEATTDVYSLGVIAYELFLEEPPFSADNVADLIAMHLREPAPIPSDVWPDIPPALEQLLLGMLAKDPAGRPPVDVVAATLVEVRRVLEARTESRRHVRRLAEGSLPPPPGVRTTTQPAGVPIVVAAPADAAPRTPAPRRARRHRAPWVLASVAAAAVGFAVVTIAARISGGTHADQAAPGADAGPTRPAPPLVTTTMPPPAAVPVASIPPSSLDLRVSPRSARIHIDGVSADADGGRLVRALAAGAHDLVIEAPGYQTVRRRVDIATAGTLQLEVRLDPVPRKRTPRRAERRRPAVPVDPDGTIDVFE